ncbi:MAG: hypothetical protein RJB38_657 [Pseudomonadota bacterium]|jgi:murein DD-endopeptidase MepM/ murein hydrolase activator NlpD
MALVGLGLMALPACASGPMKRTKRVGWLETLDRSAPTAGRQPASDWGGESSGRRGLLQMGGSRKAASLNSSSEIDQVRLARWKRLVQNIRLSWPLRSVQVTSAFGNRQGDLHEGIDLRAPMATPVYASHDGVVLYSGSGISGYGKLIVLRHPSGLSTVYAHNSRLLVRRGERIRRGQRLSLSGNTGRSSGPHLHFEVRTGLVAVDPLKWVQGPWEDRARGAAGASSSGRRLVSRGRSTLAASSSVR